MSLLKAVEMCLNNEDFHGLYFCYLQKSEYFSIETTTYQFISGMAESRGNVPEKRRFPRLSDKCSVMAWCFPVKSNSYLNYADLHEELAGNAARSVL